MSRYNLHKHIISTCVRHLSSVCWCESVCKPSCQPLSSLALYCLWHILGLPAAQWINRRTYLSACSVIPMHSLLDFCWSMAFFQYKSLTRIHYACSDICQVSCHEENWVCASQCGCQRFLTSTFSNLETCMKVCLVCHNCPFSNDCCPLQVYPPLPLFLSSRIITADNNNMTSCLWRSFLCSSLYLSLLPRWSDKLVSDRWCYWWFCFYSSSQKTMRLCLSCSYCEGQSLCVVVVIMIIILLIIIAE